MQITRFEAVREWMQQLSRMQTYRPATPHFVRPYHLVAYALKARSLGMNDLYIPNEVQSYAARMGLWEAVGLEPPFPVAKRPNEGRFLPVQRITCEADAHSHSQSLCVIADSQQHGGMSEEARNSLLIMLDELLENAQKHSEGQPEFIGLAAAQAWPGGNMAQIAIADLGIGIRQSLASNTTVVSELENANACELASRYGVTSKPEHHSGYGLALARELMTRSGGQFMVFSGGEAYVSGNHGDNSVAMPAEWPGTLILLEWKLDRPLRVLDVYRDWPLPEGIDDDDVDAFGEEDWLT